MAVCDNHGTGRSGKTHSLYVTVIHDKVRYSRRLKLCTDCVVDITSQFGSQWSDNFVLVKFNPNSACNSCGQLRGELGTLHPLYAVGYGRSDQRYDYSAQYCGDCAKSIISLLRLDVTPNGHV